MIFGDEGLQSRSELEHDPAASLVALGATKNIERLITTVGTIPVESAVMVRLHHGAKATLLNTS